MTYAEWRSEGTRLFGPDAERWQFICPACGHITTPADWRAAGADDGEIAFSCIGRHIEGAREAFGGKGAGPCNYAGGGLFRLNPVEVEGGRYFAFAKPAAVLGQTGGAA
jgi:hypothetical protein